MNDILNLVNKYNTQGPRYTSYPTVPQWSDPFGEKEFKEKLLSLDPSAENSFSLYTHIPFCEEKCYYCACNVVITQQKDQADLYLKYLKKELDLVCGSLGANYPVSQFHWGGGTPTYLSCAQIETLFSEYKKRFTFLPDAEISLEIDPRVTSFEQLKLLKSLGFNRISMGVQDFDEKVQTAIHRNQTEEETRKVFDWCRKLGFSSINMDFVYGLPYQTEQGFKKNIRTILEFKPDRIAFYNYAHVPWLISYQKYIPDDSLPTGDVKIKFLLEALNMFKESGYEHIGMDHFAKSYDELVQAQKDHTLRRNFMGYTTQKESLLLAFGVSSISEIQNVYSQNQRKLSDYYKALDENRWPVMKGRRLSHDDMIRHEVIMELMCNLHLSISDMEKKFSISFWEYFEKEQAGLAAMAKDGLLTLDAQAIQITSLGRLFIRNISMVFDAYEMGEKQGMRYSKTV